MNLSGSMKLLRPVRVFKTPKGEQVSRFWTESGWMGKICCKGKTG